MRRSYVAVCITVTTIVSCTSSVKVSSVSKPKPGATNAPSTQTHTVSTKLNKSSNTWKSDDSVLAGFAIDIPKSNLGENDLTITAKLTGTGTDALLTVTGDRGLTSSAIKITLPTSMVTGLDSTSLDSLQILFTPVDINGNKAGEEAALSKDHLVKSNSDFVVSMSGWGTIKIKKIDQVTIVSVTSSPNNASYKAGDAITLTVTFSEEVTVACSPTLSLNFGAPAVATYVSGSGSKTLIFSYTIAASDNISNLDYASTSALSGSGTISGASGSSVVLTLPTPGATGSIASSGSISVDTVAPTAPTLTGSTLTNNTQPTISWSAGTGGSGTYRYRMDHSDLTSGATSTDVTHMTPASALTNGAHTLYVQERDLAGNWSTAGSFAFTIDTNIPGAPSVVSAASTTTNSQPTWTWTSAGAPGVGSYRYKLDDSSLTSGATTTAVASYTPGSALADGAHTLYVQESNVNGSWSTSGSYVITIDSTAPTVANVTSNKADATYSTLADTVDVRVTFSEAVTVTGSPKITMETGATDRDATYTSGSGSTTLVFTYTIQLGDVSSDLTYVATSSLALNGGTIKDAAGNNATLTLASPTASGSLAANKAIVISAAIPPSSFTISSTTVGNGRVTLTWGAASGAASYTLKRGTSTGSYPTTLSTSATSPYADTGLTNGTAYYYMVTAVNTYGTTDASAEATGTPYIANPSFTSISLTGAASDGVLDRSELQLQTAVVGSLVAADYGFVGYAVVSSVTTCSSVAIANYTAAIPLASNPLFAADGNYKICVAVLNAAYTAAFGESATIAVDRSVLTGKTVLAIESGPDSDHTCAILSDNSLKCWGDNSYGQLGIDSTTSKGLSASDMATLPAVNLGTSRTAKAVALGKYHTCAILDDDTLKCWGYGGSGQLGYDGTTSKGNSTGSMATVGTVNLGTGRTAKAVSAAGYSTCAILDNDTLKCWGDNSSGNLGYDSTASKGNSVGSMAALAAVNLGSGRTAKTVKLSQYYTCAILDNDNMKCWGDGGAGNLGYDSTATKGAAGGDMAALAAINLGTSRTALSIGIGGGQTCAILDDDTLKCWGGGSNGQRGSDSVTSVGTSGGQMAALGTVNLGTGRTAVSVKGGSYHTCVLLDNATMKCFGNNNYGQLGYNNGTQMGSSSGQMAVLGTVNLGSGRTPLSIAAGKNHTCAVLDNNTAKCWGDYASGQLGYGNNNGAGIAASMSSMTKVNLGASRTAKMSALGEYFACAILDDDKLKCWGRNHNGQLGYDSTTNLGSTVGDMSGLASVNLGTGRTAKSVSAGAAHTCALLDNNTVKCWGVNNFFGQLGYDDTTIRGNSGGSMAALAAVNLGTGRTAKGISCGGYHTCALLDNDKIKCWGQGSSGQLGYDSTAHWGEASGDMAALAYVNLGTGRTAKSVVAGEVSTCAILDTDELKCWGNNSSGQLGQDSTSTLGALSGDMAALNPINLGTGRTAKSVGVGSIHVCALLDTNDVKCWGGAAYGQTGYNTTISRGNSSGSMAALSTVDLGTGRTAISLTVGRYHTCVVRDDNTTKCWGGGSWGSAGQDTTVANNSAGNAHTLFGPINMGPTTAVYSGTYALGTCASLTNSDLMCWGSNDYGALGSENSVTRGGGFGVSELPGIYFP